MEDLGETASIQPSGIRSEPTLIDDAIYRAMYVASIRDSEMFWREHGKRIDWIKPYTRVKNTSSRCLDQMVRRPRHEVNILSLLPHRPSR